MTTLGVLPHSRKAHGHGSRELCGALGDAGCSEPLGFGVEKSQQAPKDIRRWLDSGIERLLVPAS